MANRDSEPSPRTGIADDSVTSVPVEGINAQFTNNATVLSENKGYDSSPLQKELETTIIYDHTNNTENINNINSNNNIISNLNSNINNVNISDNNININNNKISDNNSNINGINGSTTSSTSTRPYINEGLDIWNKRRELWTRGNHDPNSPQSAIISSENRNNPLLANITPNNYNSIYDSLIHEKKMLTKPIPLSYVIKILVSGWKRDGVWPSDPPSASSSNTNGPTLH